MDSNPILKNNLKLARTRAGLTQQEIADLVSVSRQTIISIEKGDYVPSTMLAFLLAHALGCDINNLFYLSNQNSNESKKE